MCATAVVSSRLACKLGNGYICNVPRDVGQRIDGAICGLQHIHLGPTWQARIVSPIYFLATGRRRVPVRAGMLRCLTWDLYWKVDIRRYVCQLWHGDAER